MVQGPKGYIAQIKYVKYTWSMETVQKMAVLHFFLVNSKFHSNIYSILFDSSPGTGLWAGSVLF